MIGLSVSSLPIVLVAKAGLVVYMLACMQDVIPVSCDLREWTCPSPGLLSHPIPFSGVPLLKKQTAGFYMAVAGMLMTLPPLWGPLGSVAQCLTSVSFSPYRVLPMNEENHLKICLTLPDDL